MLRPSAVRDDLLQGAELLVGAQLAGVEHLLGCCSEGFQGADDSRRAAAELRLSQSDFEFDRVDRRLDLRGLCLHRSGFGLLDGADRAGLSLERLQKTLPLQVARLDLAFDERDLGLGCRNVISRALCERCARLGELVADRVGEGREDCGRPSWGEAGARSSIESFASRLPAIDHGVSRNPYARAQDRLGLCSLLGGCHNYACAATNPEPFVASLLEYPYAFH